MIKLELSAKQFYTIQDKPRHVENHCSNRFSNKLSNSSNVILPVLNEFFKNFSFPRPVVALQMSGRWFASFWKSTCHLFGSGHNEICLMSVVIDFRDTDKFAAA